MKNVVLTAQVAELSGLKNALYNLPEKIIDFGIRVLFLIVLFFVGVQVIKLIRKIVKKAMEKADADKSVITFMDSFIKIGLYVVLVFLLATNLGVDAASVVALLGSAGVAIGLAVQGSLSNLAGGVLILLLKPFRIGDYIIDSAGNEGTVNEVHIFYTTLLTADNKTVILPNGALANNSITNVSTQTTRRVDILVGISYDSDIRVAREVIMKLMDTNDMILKDGTSTVYVNELAGSSVDLGIRCWVNSADYWTVKGWLTENVKYALDEAGVSIPFPQLDVHLDK